jgi:hypothetical protein
MKARHFKKLRIKLGSVQTYSIRETCSLFGDFFGYNRMGLVMSDTNVVASSPLRAILIYMKRYRKEYKRKNEYECREYDEVSEKWGRLMVKDESGFMTFYR